MKKIFLAIVTVLLIVSLTGCKIQEASENHATYNETASDVQSNDTEENDNSKQENDVLKSESDSADSNEKTVDKVIEAYNSKIKLDSPNSSQADIDALLVSYDRKEVVSQHNIVSYEYSIPNNAIGIVLFEDIDTKEITFGSIEINKNIITPQNENSILQGFMQMCYYLTYALDSTSEDEFMAIWRAMRNNEGSIAIYPNVAYQLQDSADYLTFAIQYSK